MQGKGYESEEFYNFIKFEFANIENVHVMRTSLSKVLECKLAGFKLQKLPENIRIVLLAAFSYI